MRPRLFIPEVQETTAMGAAFAAGLAVGVGKNQQTRDSSPVEGNLRKTTFVPTLPNEINQSDKNRNRGGLETGHHEKPGPD